MRAIALACTLLLAASSAIAKSPALTWRVLQPGVEYTSTPAGLHIVRIAPHRARVTAALASEVQGQPRTAGEWCRTAGLAVAINAGMFQTDHLSNVGYLRHGKHVNNGRWNDYRAVLAVDASRARWLDLEGAKIPGWVANYPLVVQNLRLITAARKNVWAANDKLWSEAALAVDAKGRLLFLFSRAPYTMRDFNRMLLELPLEIAGAMHLEGGPEASLSIHAGGIDLDLAGSFETGFRPDDSNDRQWPIPNVLGVARQR